MLILQQFTSASCVVCRRHKPILDEIEAVFDGDLTVKYVDVATLLEEEADAIQTVPFYRLLQDGVVKEQWCGIKEKSWIIEKIEEYLE